MLLCLPLLWGCKTNENNYRQAYEKAIEAREAADADLDSTIYGVPAAILPCSSW